VRFLLDNDVAVTVRGLLVRAGHECWTAAEANLHDASDDVLAVYAPIAAPLWSHTTRSSLGAGGRTRSASMSGSAASSRRQQRCSANI
jgi:hypothetical protein